MNYTENVSQEACTAAGYLYANCTNKRDEVSIGGMDHGGYELTCTSSTQEVRESCALELINADRPADASAAGFEDFLAEQGTFFGRHDLAHDADNNAETVFLWNVTEDGKVDGLMGYNGMVSWMAWGIENRGGGLRGMSGASVIFGISFQDTEFPGLGGTVQEYMIDHEQSRFSFWNAPYPSPATTDTEMLSQGGYTVMKFKTDAIFGESLNITSGSNRLIWAYRASSYMHVGRDSYHETCDGLTRTRGRGGGADYPWVMDFQSPSAPTTTTTSTVAEDTTTTTSTVAGEVSAAGTSASGVAASAVAAYLLFS
jgi:hypothetical protein